MSNLVKSLVRTILEQPYDHEWTLQGLGMLRLYLDREHRMHIWDSRFAVENVSQMHTHPWNFTSQIIAGVVRNQRFAIFNDDHVTRADMVEEYYQQSIFCGMGGGLEGASQKVLLEKQIPEIYREGESYDELAHEIHFSKPDDGTVTIVRRTVIGDPDHALVFWKEGDWVSAEPRSATESEIRQITQRSLEYWF